ncbi:MAG: hypothetical protein A3D75_01620 [Candidatus Levybacteria bacterium RIFCSPHIGHO2_02_FULL_37_18]|nr:MAG: hypothetical protein A2794_01865 [Alphaproteobacteria bacterium RIFCSPHIGHO2_01_FULL_40_8]OGH21685.1 MAG: hypothetical protein A3D75_01620 [Candidatus Levybacteria bacterium RIFCSPHIGHO2_02_FULL_37_18]OGH33261.1 MAG: hypothetical protein A3A47_03000 [Candidatus Levybacteria bacterium RIFCSPLOWO2_01_FULL_37_20]
MKLLYAIDFESWVFPETEKFLSLTSEERKKIDNEYSLKSGYQLLDLLQRKKQKLTFFVIGQIYEWYPQLIKDIASEGHEIAFHTHSHSSLKNIKILKEELEEGCKFIQEFNIKGFQAPNINFPAGGHYLLKEAGFTYSSSIYSSSKKIFEIDGVKEIPVSIFNFFGKQNENISFPTQMKFRKLLEGIPFGSSYFTALLGGKKTYKIIKKMENRGYEFVNLFIHNWQIYLPEKASFPNTIDLIKNPLYLPYTKNIKNDFEYLLDNFKFSRFSDFLKI